jgi:hypothetical protein
MKEARHRVHSMIALSKRDLRVIPDFYSRSDRFKERGVHLNHVRNTFGISLTD